MEFLSHHLLLMLFCLNTIVDGKPYQDYPKRCLNHLDKPPVDDQGNYSCKFGLVVDKCGYEHCIKGPGEFCGGRNNVYGICASGLECSDCNRCRGCSVKTLKCFEDECLKILYRFYGKLG